MAVTAQQVKQLRDRTGVGLGDCKRALEECGGDMEAAIQKLREQGLAKAAKKAGRETREGRVYIVAADDASKAAMVEINCETDFVARNEQFAALCTEVGLAALNGPDALSTPEELGEVMGPEGRTVAAAVQETFNRIGENMRVGRLCKFVATDNGAVGYYLHFNNRVGVLVHLEAEKRVDGLVAIANEVSMHIAMANPEVVGEADLDPARLESERQLLIEEARKEGKPEGALEKIVSGQMAKQLAERCLLLQPYIRDEKGKTTIAQHLAARAKEIGVATPTVKGFARFSLDESSGDEAAADE
ncbi:MAG: translation elongation factor Ts [candidate division WS1 bacterium]|jgi:elongation factor Ts|nr:translation elongation factor Ts [candidate division WS1 bacterium]